MKREKVANMKVTLIGMGPGSPSLLTAQARQAIGEARLLLGAPRLLEPFRPTGIPCREAVSPSRILEILREEAPDAAAVLLSGDPGFYSGAKNLLPLLEQNGIEPVLLCGVSTLQYFCARLRRPWNGIHTASAHGRDCDPAAALRASPCVFFLTGEKVGQTPGDLCQALEEEGFGGAKAWVGSRLSYSEEALFSGEVRELAGKKFPSPNVLLVQRQELPAPWPYATGIPDGEFLRREGIPMTKEEVRAVALQKLRVAPGDTLWDVGAGTGSVTVELARLAPRGRVYAVERLPEACDLIRCNAEKFVVSSNISVVEGEAPAALASLPPPDAVFLGGSGGALPAIARAVLEKNPHARLVIPAVTLETIGEAARLFRELPLSRTDITQITAARAGEAGRFRLLRGQDPVFLFCGAGGGEGKK